MFDFHPDFEKDFAEGDSDFDMDFVDSDFDMDLADWDFDKDSVVVELDVDNSADTDFGNVVVDMDSGTVAGKAADNSDMDLPGKVECVVQDVAYSNSFLKFR